RRQFPADRLPRCGSLHEQCSGRRLDRPRPARASCIAALAAGLGRHPRAERCASAMHRTLMNGRRILFLDRDGTLNEETADEQIDSLEKIRLMPGVVPALLELKAAGFAFVMVTNQDGLGTPSFPQERFDRAHRFILELFASQGIEFEAVCICPHFKREDCSCRKPRIGMVQEYLAAQTIDKTHSYMVGDRDTDMEFAVNLGVQGLRIRL